MKDKVEKIRKQLNDILDDVLLGVDVDLAPSEIKDLGDELRKVLES